MTDITETATTLANKDQLSTPSNNVSGRLRLEFLDGIRGVAALYVVFHHIWGEASWNDQDRNLPLIVRKLMSFFTPGTYGVTMFIVLSGFCLMMPVVRSADLSLRGGIREYIRRRAFRILPPYYIVLFISIAVYYCFYDLNHGIGMMARMSHVTDADNLKWAVISHLGVFHNVNQVWAYKFNSPLWSVATEWQIYFFLPLLFLPVWKRFGLAALTVTGMVVCLIPHFAFKGRVDSGEFTLLGAFALGMVGAAICFSNRPLETLLRTRVPWAALACISTIVVLVLNMKLSYDKYYQILGLIASLPALSLICYCALWKSENGARRPFILSLLESGPALKLGAMSYSLYLTHILVVEVMNSLFLKMQLGPLKTLIISLPVVSVLSLIVAYGFHIAVERRFMTTAKK